MNDRHKFLFLSFARVVLLVLTLLSLPAAVRGADCVDPPPCDPDGIGVSLQTDGDLEINNCTGASVRAFIRVAMAEIGTVTQTADGANFRAKLHDPLPTGCTPIEMPFPSTGLPNPRVVSAWLRIRQPYDGSPTAGDVLTTKVETAWTDPNAPLFSLPEAALIARRVASDLRGAVLSIPAITISDCYDPDEKADVAVRNRSATGAYRVVVSGKYTCIANPSDPPTSAAGNEDFYDRWELGPESCCRGDIKMSSEVSGFHFPGNCDCDHDGGDGQCPCTEPPCTARQVISCVTYVVTEAKATDGNFKGLPEAIWSDFSEDVTIKHLNMDVNIHETDPYTPEDINFGCEDFGTGPIVDFISLASNCDLELAELDSDFDGIGDRCDPLVASWDSVAGGRSVKMQAVVRNVSFSGDPHWGPNQPAETFDPGYSYQVLVGGDASPSVSVETEPPPGSPPHERLLFTLPNQDAATSVPPGEGGLDVEVTAPEGLFTRENFLESLRMAYVATSTPGAEGLLVPLRSTASDASGGNIGAFVAILDDPNLPERGTPRLSASEVFGLDVGAQRTRVVASLEGGVEVLDTATGERLADVVELWHAPGRSGRGVAVEDEVDGGFARYAYVLVSGPGKIRVVDLEDPNGPSFVVESGTSYFPPVLNAILGEPLDIEIRPDGGDVFAYVTSVKEPDGGGGGAGAGMSGDNEIIPDPGGGGGCTGRKTILTVLRMGRPNNFITGLKEQTIQLSCVAPSLRPWDFGLEAGLAWNAARDTLYVAVPDLDGVKALPRLADGTLDTYNEVFIPTGMRPTDLVIGTFNFAGNQAERAVVVTRGTPEDPVEPEDPGFAVFRTDDPGSVDLWFFDETDPYPQPLSVSAHLGSSSLPYVIIADSARQEIRVVQIDIGATRHRIPTTTTPKRVTAQGQ
jgi:hypothetical protein